MCLLEGDGLLTKTFGYQIKIIIFFITLELTVQLNT